MGSVLIWFLLGGVGLYTLSKLASGGGDVMTVKRTYADGRLDHYGTVARKEKFQDPLYLCFGGEKPYTIGSAPRSPGLHLALYRGDMDDNQSDVTIGYEYLADVPATAKARVAAMRAKIKASKSAAGKTTLSPDGAILKGLIRASEDTLTNFAGTAKATYDKIAKSGAAAKDFAEKVGVPTSLVEDEASELAAYMSSHSRFESLDKMVKTYGPIATTIVSGVFDYIDAGLSGGSPDASASSALKYLSSLALAIPGYGFIISAAVDMLAGSFIQADEEKHAFCRETQKKIQDIIDDTIKLGLVVPWHATKVFDPNDCGASSLGASGLSASESQHSLLLLLGMNKALASGQEPTSSQVVGSMSPGDVMALRRWWALAQMYMAEPRVREVFSALGQDASGGVVASDEQVMLVAAPYAIANGITVDEFAEELYSRCGGWKVAPESSLRFYNDTKICKDRCYGCEVPWNAWWVQWAILSDKAREIVADWNKIRDERLKAAISKAPSLAGKLLPL